jgi:hypothetical protein
MDTNNQHPLNDIWEIYSESLDVAVTQGLLGDSELGDGYVWPPDLDFKDWEQEDVKRYVAERLQEIVESIKNKGGVDPHMLQGYLFRSVLCGMMWEKERVGR